MSSMCFMYLVCAGLVSTLAKIYSQNRWNEILFSFTHIPYHRPTWHSPQKVRMECIILHSISKKSDNQFVYYLVKILISKNRRTGCAK